MEIFLDYDGLRAVHPGYYIGQLWEESHVSVEEYAAKLSLTEQQLIALMEGRLDLNYWKARNISKALGNRTKTWLDCQKEYDRNKKEIYRRMKQDGVSPEL